MTELTYGERVTNAVIAAIEERDRLRVEVGQLRQDLAAAKVLLGEARGIVHAYLRGWPNSDAGELMDRIDAALAGEKK